MDIAIGAVILVASVVLFWSCLPIGNEMIPFLKKPGMEVTVTLLIVIGVSVGGALLIRGLIDL